MKAKFLALAALVLGLASCQTEPEGINVDANGEAAVTLNVALPDDATRAAGKDSAKGGVENVDLANDYDIRYILEVYDENGKLAKERMTEYSDASSASFTFRLVPGRPYKFVVWADFVAQVDVARDPKANYDLHYNTANGLRAVKVKMDSWTVIDESRDAYTAVETVANFSSAADIPTITLTRPFAKLRVVTNDITEMISIRPTEVKVNYFSTKFYDTFDAYDSKTTNNLVDAPVNLTAILSDDTYTGENPNKTGIQTLFADYFFGAEQDRVMFTMDVKDNSTPARDLPQVTFNTNIPVKRNNLTTVYGPVLTDANNITVTIDPTFENGTEWNPEDDKYDVEVWDGKTLSAPKYNATDDVYEISNGSQFAYFAASINGTLPATTATRAETVNYTEETIVLTADIDLGGNEWTPIGVDLNHAFAGSFDGQNYKVANFVISGNATSQAALFGTIRGSGSFKNVVVDNATVLCPVTSGETNYYGAGFAAQLYGTHTFENITVQNSKIQGSGKTGGLIGFNGDCAQVVKNCHVANCVVESTNPEDGGNIGGLVGFWQCEAGGSSAREFLFENCSVKETTINAFNSQNAGKRANAEFLGGFKSKTGWTLNIDHCTVAENTFNETINGKDAVTYESHYDGVFVGGDRTGDCLATVIINGTRYEGKEEPKNVSAEDGEFYATIDDALKANNNEVALGDGEFALPSTLATDTTDGNTVVTISGNGIDKSTVKGSNNANGNAGAPGNYAHGLDLVFENLTYVTVNNGYQGGFGHAKSVTFRNCKIVGQFYCHSNAPHFFYDCTIDPLTGYLYTYASDCVFEGCHFAASEGKALQVYAEAAGTFTTRITNCTFKAAKQAATWDGLPVTGIDINSAYGAFMNVYVEECTTEGFPVGLNSGSDLWNVKNGGKAYANLYIDGEPVWLAEYTLVDKAKYPSLFAKDGDYYVFGVEGLASLNQYFKDNWCGNNTWTPKYNIAADINAEGFTWDGVWVNVGNNYNNGLVINGNNHTISNLTINNFFLSGTPNGGDDTATPGEVKNITIDNATVVGGSHDAAIFWGSCYGDVNFENVTVKNSKISGGSNVGAFVSRTTIENAEAVVNLKFTNCKVENCELSADNLSADPTGASGFIGRAYGNTTLSFKGTNSVDAATVINNAEGLVGGRVYGYGVWANGGWTGLGACDSFTAFEGVKFVETNDIKEIETVSPGENTTLTDDVNGSAKDTNANSGYGATGVVVDGGVFDGNGKTFTVSDANSTWDCAIAAKGGTIKNLTVAGAMRGIFMPGANSDLYIDNVIFDDVVYTFNSDGGNKNFGVYISNSTLNGWTSFSAVHKEVVFTNCKFGEGSGYAFCRPYNDAVFENCDFENGFRMDARGVVTFKNCTYNGVHLNKDNYTNLVTSNAQNVRFE